MLEIQQEDTWTGTDPHRFPAFYGIRSDFSCSTSTITYLQWRQIEYRPTENTLRKTMAGAESSHTPWVGLTFAQYLDWKRLLRRVIKVSFHIVVDMRQRESNIFHADFNLESFLLIKNILIMKNQTSFRKTVETGVGSYPGVDLFVSNCPLAESPTTSQCQVECWHVIEVVERFYYAFLNRGGTRGLDWVACQPPTLRTAHPKS